MKKAYIRCSYLLRTALRLYSEKILIERAMMIYIGNFAIKRKREELITELKETGNLIKLNNWIKKCLKHQSVLRKIRKLNGQIGYNRNLNIPIREKLKEEEKKLDELESGLLKLKTGQD